jgi:hypothetical protein
VKNSRVKEDGSYSEVDSKLHEYFVQASFGELHEPTTILDIHGRIMAWFLPDIICKQRLVRFIR